MPTSPSPTSFPAPVGGVPQSGDFAPSIFFAILYAFLIPALAFRLFRSESRNFVLVGTACFSIERIVVFSLRAQEAHDVSAATSNGFVTYMQTTFAAGYISIGQDLVMVLRAWLVHTTQYQVQGQAPELPTDTEMSDREYQPLTASKPQFSGRDQPPNKFSGEIYDDPRRRFWIRRACGAATIAFWVIDILAMVAGAIYSQAETKESQAQLTQQLRYASTAISLVLLLGVCAGALWAIRTIPTVARSSGYILSSASSLLALVAFYRLIVMQYQTTSLESAAKNAQNEPASKALFYVFHVLPEWLAAALMLSVNVRRRFNTGLWGDNRSRDKK